ncbi:MAG: conjugal transfer protein TraI, partial [Isosphaeraceae bacterium]|nr:conjugal transfer protein TraI [Isosphaeraceae bacterium]
SRRLASDYAAAVKAGDSALVVSPTHVEKDRITREIRDLLRREGRLGGDQKVFPVLTNARLTEAQRADPSRYQPGDVVQFQQNLRGYGRGQRVEVTDPGALPLHRADCFEVFYRGAIGLVPGDMIRITRNGTTADRKHSLHNGDLHRVKAFTPEGDMVLGNGWRVSKDFGHIDYGYVVTSHASQGKTVDRVFVGQSSDSFPASSREQFYVSASRGRKSVTVYTDDKEALRAAVMNSEDRTTASELVAGAAGADGRRPRQRREDAERVRSSRRPTRAPVEERAHER